MALTINATSGSIDANSYVTIEEANGELAYRIDTATWNNVNTTDDMKIQCLVTACRKIDSYNFHGNVAYETQALKFPRYMKDVLKSTSNDTWMIDGTYPLVPKNVKLAQILEANEIMKRYMSEANELMDRDDIIREGVAWIQNGETYERYDITFKKEFLSAEAERLLHGVIKRTFTS